jgi:hypothetical protein
MTSDKILGRFIGVPIVASCRSVVISSLGLRTHLIGGDIAHEAALCVVLFVMCLFFAHFSQRGSSFDSTNALEQARIRDFDMHRVLPLHVFGPSCCFLHQSLYIREDSGVTYPNKRLYGQSTCPSRALAPL